jgi:hypothetical protein
MLLIGGMRTGIILLRGDLATQWDALSGERERWLN